MALEDLGEAIGVVERRRDHVTVVAAPGDPHHPDIARTPDPGSRPAGTPAVCRSGQAGSAQTERQAGQVRWAGFTWPARISAASSSAVCTDPVQLGRVRPGQARAVGIARPDRTAAARPRARPR